VLECLVSGAGIELRIDHAPVCSTVSARPRAARSSRAQARRYGFATNARHQRADLDVVTRAVLVLCDGERDHAEIVEYLVGLAAKGDLELEQEGQPVSEPAARRAALEPIVARTLAQLAAFRLLEA
jgi:hypothetical protein